MNFTDLDDLLDLAEKQAQMVVFGLRKPLMPSWVIIDAKGKTQIFGTPWKNDFEKALAQPYVQARMKDFGAVAYSFLTEAWMAHQPKGWTPEQGVKVRPADRPDRQECVIACASNGSETKWRRWMMIRDHLEQVVKLEPAPMEYGEIESWMGSLLDQRPPGSSHQEGLIQNEE